MESVSSSFTAGDSYHLDRGVKTRVGVNENAMEDRVFRVGPQPRLNRMQRMSFDLEARKTASKRDKSPRDHLPEGTKKSVSIANPPAKIITPPKPKTLQAGSENKQGDKSWSWTTIGLIVLAVVFAAVAAVTAFSGVSTGVSTGGSAGVSAGDRVSAVTPPAPFDSRKPPRVTGL